MSAFYLRFPGGKSKALTLSYDDGVASDIRLIQIMKQHGLKGTFNINAGKFAPEGTTYPAGTVHRRMSQKQCFEAYKDSGMEVALHGYTHPFLDQLPLPHMLCEIQKDREALENLFGTFVRGAAYPYGTYNDDVVAALRACGVCYARTVASTEGFSVPTDWLRMPATCHHRNPKLMELAKKFMAFNVANDAKLFYLWGHSYEFDGDNNWHVIEEFAKFMGEQEGVWHATNIEVYDYVEAYRRLVVSYDGRLVYNPSVVSVWFAFAGKTYEIHAGETLVL